MTVGVKRRGPRLSTMAAPPNVPDDASTPGRIQVLDRAVELMQAIAERPRLLSAQDLARQCGLNRTTAWRILVALEHNDLVERDPATQRYGLGFALARLGASADTGTLIRISHTTMQELADELGEQVSLGVPAHLGFAYVEHVQPRGGAVISRWLGHSGPAHATASGKVFLSRLSDSERRGMLGPQLERFTDRTITDLGQLDVELAAIDRDGFAITAGEHDKLTSAVCAPICDPVTGSLIAAIDVWGASQRLPRRRLRTIGRRLAEAAGGLAAEISMSRSHDR
jgi:DNA-binding IclR family transcriptional regulator